MMANTRRYPSWQSLALVAILSLAGCGTHNSRVGGLVKDSPSSPPESTLATTGAQEPSPSASAARAPAGTGALGPAPTARASAPEPGVGSHLDRVHFAFDSYLLDEPARATLQRNAEYLSSSSITRVRVEGYCDERGSAEYNLALGERRARSAADYLSDLGISRNRLQVVTYGEERPLDASHSELAWASNRRAEFVEISR